MTLFTELKRRNVLRVGAAYVVFAWLVIQVAETIFPLYGFDDTPARIVTTALAIGLVPLLIFAWAFEPTPEGLKKEEDVDCSRSITTQTGKKLDRMIMVVLALALAYFAFDNFVLDPRREAVLEAQKEEAVEQARQAGRTEALIKDYGDKSIAVLAFQDMSPQGDQGYLSDGIAEELLNRVAKLRGLRVISRVSAFRRPLQTHIVKHVRRRLSSRTQHRHFPVADRSRPSFRYCANTLPGRVHGPVP